MFKTKTEKEKFNAKIGRIDNSLLVLTLLIFGGTIVMSFISSAFWILSLIPTLLITIWGGCSIMESMAKEAGCPKKTRQDEVNQFDIYTEEDAEKFIAYLGNAKKKKILVSQNYIIDEEKQSVFFETADGKVEELSIDYLDEITRDLEIRKKAEEQEKAKLKEEQDKIVHDISFSELKEKGISVIWEDKKVFEELKNLNKQKKATEAKKTIYL